MILICAIALCVSTAHAQSRAQLGLKALHARATITTITATPTHATLLVTLDVEPGWHVSWRNPGETGVPTRLEWELPRGMRVTGETWPVPVIAHTPVGATHTLEGAVPWLIDVAIDSARDAARSVRLTMRYGVCRDVCIVEQQTVQGTVAGQRVRVSEPIAPALRARLTMDAGVIGARRWSRDELCLSRSPLTTGKGSTEVVADSGLGLDAAQPLLLRDGAFIVKFSNVAALSTGSALLFVRDGAGATARLDFRRAAERCARR